MRKFGRTDGDWLKTGGKKIRAKCRANRQSDQIGRTPEYLQPRAVRAAGDGKDS